MEAILKDLCVKVKKSALVCMGQDGPVRTGQDGPGAWNAITGLIVSAHQGSRISCVPPANQSVIRQ